MCLGQADKWLPSEFGHPSNFLVALISLHLQIPSPPIEEETVNIFRKPYLASLSGSALVNRPIDIS